MADVGATKAARAYVELFLDRTKLDADLAKVAKKLESWGNSIVGMGKKIAATGAAITSAFAGASAVYARSGDAILKMSQRTGIAVESLSQLSFAADQSGTSIDSLESAVRNMQRVIDDAATNTGEAVDALADLGLTAEELQGLGTEEQVKLLADRLASIESTGTRAAKAMAVFGRNASEVLPMLSLGANGIADLQMQADKLGMTISTRDAEAASKFGDQLGALWAVIKHGTFVVGSSLAPLLGKVAGLATQAAAAMSKWIDENRGLVVLAFQAGAAITALGVSIILFGKSLTVASSAVSALSASIKFFLNWKTLLVAGIAAVAFMIGRYLVQHTEAGAKMMRYLASVFGEVRHSISDAWSGIVAAVGSGDLAGAFEIAWTAVKLVWQRGMLEVTKLWPGFEATFSSMGDRLLEIFITVSGAFSRAWVSVTSTIKSLFFKLVASITSDLEKVLGVISDIQDSVAKSAAWSNAKKTQSDAMFVNRVAADANASWWERNRAKVIASEQGFDPLMAARGQVPVMSDDEIRQHIMASSQEDTSNPFSMAGIRSRLRSATEGSLERSRQISRDADKQLLDLYRGEQEKLNQLRKISDANASANLNAREQEIREQEAKVDELKKKLSDLSLNARIRADLDRAFPDETTAIKPPTFDELNRTMTATVKAFGTFSAEEASRFGSNTNRTLTEIEKASKKTADNTRRIADSQPAFQ